MSEPGSLPSAAAARQESLWEKAPSWRGLVVTASLLTLAAVTIPVLLPAPSDPIPPLTHAVPQTVAALPPPARTPPAQIQHDLAPAPRHMARLHPAVQTAKQQPQPATSCALRQTATAPRLVGAGTVVSFEDPALALANIQATEAQSGGKIDPAYIDNQRVIVQRPNGQTNAFILPKGMVVKVGDRVMLQNGYRNIALPCNYVPIQVASDIGPPPASQASPPAEAPSPPEAP